jgi:hypothetical protein
MPVQIPEKCPELFPDLTVTKGLEEFRKVYLRHTLSNKIFWVLSAFMVRIYLSQN